MRVDARSRILVRMTHISFVELQQNLSRYLDEAFEAKTPLTVSRENGEGNVVLMSEAEFSGWQETVYILSDPRDTERLLRGIRQADAGQLQEHELPLPEAASNG